MTKPFSAADFSEQIIRNRSWRLREISDLKSAIIKSDNQLQRVLLRSLITICYAHWEGYVRFAGRKYLEHVALRKHRFADLDRQFLRNYFLPKLAGLSASKSNLIDRCNLVDEILDASNVRFTRANNDLINTKSNLSFDVLADICLVCGVPADVFSTNKTFVDVLLLKRRNAVAHGEETFVEIADLNEITNETIALEPFYPGCP